MSIGLGAYAILALSFSIVFEFPTSQAIQIGISKILIFSVIAYMLFLCTKTYAAHQHNAAVNRHRQNSLLSFNALVEAAGSEDKRDIVLSHAAGSIFAPQDTGYVRNSSPPQLPMTQLIEAMPRIAQTS
jgi:hypothetical protein